LAAVLAGQGDIDRAERELRTKQQMMEMLAAHDPANAIWQQELADTDGELGTLLAGTRRIKDAVDAHHQAIARLDQLMAVNPGHLQSRQSAAQAQRMLGDTHFAAGQFYDGLKAYQSGLKAIIELARKYPDLPEVQRAKAIAYAKAAQIYADGLNDRSAALALYRNVVTTFEQLTRDHPADVVSQSDLSAAHEELGRFFAAGMLFEEAVTEFRAALAITGRLVAGEATNVAWQGDLIRLQHAAGSALLARGDLPGAANAFAQALARSQTLAREHPDEVSWHSLAAVGHERTGTLHRRRGDPQAAAASYREALASLQEAARLAPDSREVRQNLETMRALVSAIER
jgi:tetratricopeptide (TPR) repeat protein